MPEAQSRLTIASVRAIDNPACPKCQVQMMRARIMLAFRGTDLHMFECEACDYILNTLAVCESLRSPRDLEACGLVSGSEKTYLEAGKLALRSD
jgi:hypothetical protein